MLEQQPIVALNHPLVSKKPDQSHNDLLLSLNKNDLELTLYSNLDPKLVAKILKRVVLWLIYVT